MLTYHYKLKKVLGLQEFGRGFQEEEQGIICWSKGAWLADQHFLYIDIFNQSKKNEWKQRYGGLIWSLVDSSNRRDLRGASSETGHEAGSIV